MLYLLNTENRTLHSLSYKAKCNLGLCWLAGNLTVVYLPDWLEIFRYNICDHCYPMLAAVQNHLNRLHTVRLLEGYR